MQAHLRVRCPGLLLLLPFPVPDARKIAQEARCEAQVLGGMVFREQIDEHLRRCGWATGAGPAAGAVRQAHQGIHRAFVEVLEQPVAPHDLHVREVQVLGQLRVGEPQERAQVFRRLQQVTQLPIQEGADRLAPVAGLRCLARCVAHGWILPRRPRGCKRDGGRAPD